LVLNPGSERNLISICLKNQDKILDVENEEIFNEHFSVPAHKYIFMAMMYLYSKNIRPTSMAIYEVLKDKSTRKTINDMGGLEYLTMLEESDVAEDNLPIFIAKIKQSYTRKSLYQICKNTEDFVLSDGAEVLNPTELISEVESQINDLSVTTTSNDEVYKMGSETSDILEERQKNPDTVPGLETGWTQFDRYTNGFQPGDLVVVVAESKTGKSVMLTNWATQISIIDKLPVLYFDSEMSHREQEDRILSRLSHVPHHEIVSGMYVLDTEYGLAKDKTERIKKAHQLLLDGNYYHIYMPHFNIEKVNAIAKKFQLQNNIKAVFFDYIKIPSNQSTSFKNLQEYQMLGFFTSGLKDLAGTLQIPVITAAQSNRSNLGSTEKDASNIGGSYRILQLASKLMFLSNKPEERIIRDGIINGNQVLNIKYQRNAQSDCDPINIMFDKPYLHQKEI